MPLDPLLLLLPLLVEPLLVEPLAPLVPPPPVPVLVPEQATSVTASEAKNAFFEIFTMSPFEEGAVRAACR